MFYLSRPVSDGPPTEDCAVAIIHSIKGKFSIALLSLIGMISFWWAAFSASKAGCGLNSSIDSPYFGKNLDDTVNTSGMNTTRD
jgi:hypothetical protein